LTGHKTEAIYRRYAIVSEADLIEAVRRPENRSVGIQMFSNPDAATAARWGGTEEKPL